MKTLSKLFSGKTLALVAVLGAGAMVTADFAEARGGRGGSFGSRGSRTFSAPPPTTTAPRAAQPIQKSITQPGRPSAGAAANTARQATRGGLMRNLLLGGLVGAALASLFGAGMFANVLGFLLQGLLIAGLVMLVVSFFRNRSASNQPAMARASVAGSSPTPGQQAYRESAGGLGAQAPEVAISGDDYNAFERLLKEVQLGYANADVNALSSRLTPEMLSQFAHELEDNKRRGLSNDLSEPKLLQGDLAEAWREGASEYATVAMRYELIDALVDVKSGRVVEGSTTEPQEVVELWTFYRPAGAGADKWELSAIQQA
ncbi:MAG: Tim44 domain-containing protein [Hyphomicrobiaceae bacterium]